MTIQEQLQALIGQRVNVDQSHTYPPFVSGILLQDEDDDYTVGDPASAEGTWFHWRQVAQVVGHGIDLIDPDPELRFTLDDDPDEPFQFDDTDEISGWHS